MCPPEAEVVTPSKAGSSAKASTTRSTRECSCARFCAAALHLATICSIWAALQVLLRAAALCADTAHFVTLLHSHGLQPTHLPSLPGTVV